MSRGGDIPHASRSDVGQRRDHNEDAVYVEMPLLVVADGVGGSAKGEVASRLAIDTFVTAAADVLVARGSDEAVRAMEQAVLAATGAVPESQLAVERRRGMATTTTAAVVRDGREVIVGHVGDSRLYVLSAAGARQASSDHSVVAELVRSGRLAPEDVSSHPQRNVITRALGPDSDVQVDAFTMHVGPGDWLLACSDGLTEHVADDELARIVLDSAGDPDAAARRLVALANERGGTDNITVALAQPVPSDVSGELRIEALEAAAGTASAGAIEDVATPEPDASLDARAVETSGELPVLQPIHDEEPVAARRGGSHVRTILVGAVLLALVVAVVAFTWSRSYFLLEREDGSVGIDRGFPIAGLSTQWRDSDVQADDLDPAERERLVDSHRMLSREDPARVLDELPRRLQPADGPGVS